MDGNGGTVHHWKLSHINEKSPAKKVRIGTLWGWGYGDKKAFCDINIPDEREKVRIQVLFEKGDGFFDCDPKLCKLVP